MSQEQKGYEVSRIIAQIVDWLQEYFDGLLKDKDYYDKEIIDQCIESLLLIKILHRESTSN